MSRIQGGALVPQVELFPLDELVRPVIERASLADPSSRIVSEIPDDLPPVQVDGALLDRVLTNLVDNAARHAPPGSTVRLRAAAGPDNTVAITVEDGGPGVPDEAMESIFERFARIDERPTRDRRGFGLGLAVVRGLVEAMGGHARATRERARRARRHGDDSLRPGAPQPMSPDAPLLLLVEDDDLTRRLWRGTSPATGTASRSSQTARERWSPGSGHDRISSCSTSACRASTGCPWSSGFDAMRPPRSSSSRRATRSSTRLRRSTRAPTTSLRSRSACRSSGLESGLPFGGS